VITPATNSQPALSVKVCPRASTVMDEVFWKRSAGNGPSARFSTSSSTPSSAEGVDPAVRDPTVEAAQQRIAAPAELV